MSTEGFDFWASMLRHLVMQNEGQSTRRNDQVRKQVDASMRDRRREIVSVGDRFGSYRQTRTTMQSDRLSVGTFTGIQGSRRSGEGRHSLTGECPLRKMNWPEPGVSP